MENLWTKKETAILIDLWKSCPVLYDSSMENYSSKQVRYKTMACIVKELEKVGISKTVIQVKRKMRTLRSQLCRETKRKRSEVFEPRLWCFNELSFIWPSSFSSNAHREQYISSDSSDTRTTKNSLKSVEPMQELETEDIKWTKTDTFLQSAKEEEKTHMVEVPEKANSTMIATNLQSEKKLEERQEAFCKYLAIELKQITNDDLFDELKLEILQLVSKKMKHQSNILPEEHPINIKDYVSFIS